MNKTASNRPIFNRHTIPGSALILAVLLLFGGPSSAQSLDQSDLEELIAPIALYPDDVLGIILPASTFPLEIVQAARFLDALERDPTLEPDEDWDAAVVALLNYPEILRMMNEDLDWTWALGEAVLTDETAVLAAAQSFRTQALLAGNLVTDDKQIVSEDDGVIEIVPADPKVVYIPIYEPREVIVTHAVPVYRYYPIGYPIYYYPYTLDYLFPSHFFWGVTSYFSIGWHTHHLHVHHHSHYLHPYYLNSFYDYSPYYYRNNVQISYTIENYSNVWRPSPRRGSRPRTLTVEGRDSVVRTNRTATTESQPNLATTRRATTSTATLESGNTTRRAGRMSGAAPSARTSSATAGTGVRASGTDRAQSGSSGGTVIASSSSRTGNAGVTSSSPDSSPTRGVIGRVQRSNTTATPSTPRTGTRASAGGASPATAPMTRAPAPRSSAGSASIRSSGASRASSGPRSSGGSIGAVRSAPARTSAPAPVTRGGGGAARSSSSSSSGSRSAPSTPARAGRGSR